MSIRLYGHARSSAAFRVRVTLRIKGIDHQDKTVDLGAGEQRDARFLTFNPQGLVPVLVDGQRVLTQSLAIMEYLDERYSETPILPAGGEDKARVRSLAQIVACDIHPLNNLRVLKYLGSAYGLEEGDVLRWYRHWIAEGLSALESLTSGHPSTGRYCHGDTPTMADICLVPQIFNAQRFNCPLAEYPGLRRIFDNCMVLPPFEEARPERQADFR